MKITDLIAFLILPLIGCKHSENHRSNKNVYPSGDKWVEFRTKDSISPALHRKIVEYFNGEYMADPDQQYNPTDLMIDSLPRKQLKYLARRNFDWRISYVQGGLAKRYMFIESKVVADSVYHFNVAEVTRVLENKDTIDKLIKENKIKFNDMN